MRLLATACLVALIFPLAAMLSRRKAGRKGLAYCWLGGGAAVFVIFVLVSWIESAVGYGALLGHFITAFSSTLGAVIALELAAAMKFAAWAQWLVGVLAFWVVQYPVGMIVMLMYMRSG